MDHRTRTEALLHRLAPPCIRARLTEGPIPPAPGVYAVRDSHMSCRHTLVSVTVRRTAWCGRLTPKQRLIILHYLGYAHELPAPAALGTPHCLMRTAHTEALPHAGHTEATPHPGRFSSDADETTVSYIGEGMVIIEHLSARTGDIIRT